MIKDSKDPRVESHKIIGGMKLLKHLDTRDGWKEETLLQNVNFITTSRM
ncbi:MAG: hypothetical protein K0R73_1476 [Candidatus Midichloriaceae bacterium]|jgi:hypothetical protein|nr:hypothetical protein [Candidatus Midichloriaceae bacterium]